MTTITADRTTAPVATRVVVAAGAVLAIVGAAWGSGAFGGTPIQEAAGGALAADATLLAPATPAFAIWSVIYTGLLVFAVYQALPRPGSRPRVRSVAWHVLAAMVLNAAWIAVVQEGWLLASVGVLAAIVVVLVLAVARLGQSGPSTFIEALALDLPVGLYLGWASVATVANVTAFGVVWFGLEPGEGMPAAVGVLVAVGFLAIAVARDLARTATLAWATTGAMAWGVVWIGEGRLNGTPSDAVVGWTAVGVAAVAVAATLVTTVAARVRHSLAQRRDGRAT
ncbi:tryptophan-rich sensory protein [Demequina sp.]|uniref:tryptophan-rich sensory protein n=1 Tax=Demequina sp. TaxID=2050685 RepID=UPI0025F67A48|nr:tryptophan-rich sensory protein [Demequina sp.]